MRYAYSMLLREFVEAEEVEIGDCSRFQIACPCCREAVFKKMRARPEGGDTHFLSHYRADSPEAKECELRVESLSKDQIEHFSSTGRGQTLDSFMAVLRDAIIRGQEFLLPPGEYEKAMNRLLARPVYQDFLAYGREAISLMLRVPDPRKLVTDMLAGFPRFRDRSPFWHRRQASYTLDMLQHLSTSQAQGNLRVLIGSAYLNIGIRADEYRRDRSRERRPDFAVEPQPAINLIEALVAGKSPAALHKLNQRWSGADKARTADEAAQRLSQVRMAIITELIGPLVGSLGSIPFPDLARDCNARLNDQQELNSGSRQDDRSAETDLWAEPLNAVPATKGLSSWGVLVRIFVDRAPASAQTEESTLEPGI